MTESKESTKAPSYTLYRYEYMNVDPSTMDDDKLLIGGFNKNADTGRVEVLYCCKSNTVFNPIVWTGLDSKHNHVKKTGFRAFKSFVEGFRVGDQLKGKAESCGDEKAPN